MAIDKLFDAINKSLNLINEPLTEEQKEFIFPILETFFKSYEESIIKNIKEKISLYTNPAPSWQGLSDDEIRQASLTAKMQEHYMGYHSGFTDFARAIEQALRSKNGC